MEQAILFAPDVDDRQLDREVSGISDRLNEAGEGVPVSFDEEDLSVGGVGDEGGGFPTGGGGGGGGGGGAAAGAAGLASRVPKPVSGVIAASALPVALAGGVGLGMLSAMHESSARLQTSTTLLSQAWNSVWRPIGDKVDQLFIRPIATDLLSEAQNFEELFRSGDILGAGAQAATGLAPSEFRGGNIGEQLGTIAGALGGAAAGAKGGAAVGATAGSIIPGAGTAVGGVVGGAAGGLLGLLGGSRVLGGLGSDLQGAIENAVSGFSWPTLPEFSWPELPEFNVPEFSWPDLPEFDWPDLPDFSWPSLPEFEWPSITGSGVLASIRWPSINPGSLLGSVRWPSVNVGALLGRVSWPSIASLDLLGRVRWPSVSAPDLLSDVSFPSVRASGLLGRISWPSINANGIINRIEWPTIDTDDLIPELTGDGGGSSGGFLSRGPSIASGGRITSSGTATVHRGELVTDPDRLVDELAAAIDVDDAGGADTGAVEDKLDTLNRNVSRLAREMQNMELRTDAETIGRVATEGRQNRMGDRDPTA